MSIKSEKLSHLFVEEISSIIREEVKDKKIGFVTITGANVTSDLSYAKIYFTTLGVDINEATKALNRASGFIKMELSKRIEIRKMPEMEFIYDESISYGEKIEKIIDKINEKEDN
ncbi:MAG: 30S ribosome-binding factor RbfA [Firmicutes bacterium]|nr:30S ribosome-binding factor RbfA [Bacillota bacterium]